MALVGVLGPLLVEGPAGPVHIGSDRQRRLLVALAAHAGRTVATELLTDLVWAATPADPSGAVHTTVSRLRRLLPDGLTVETVPGGYRLIAGPGAVDVVAFADHLATANRAGPAERPDHYARALALWRGSPFAELDHPALQPEVARLVELRAAAVEQHAAALLATARPGEAVAVLEALVVAEPLREGAVGLLMRALVAAGRQGDALAAFARLRTRLGDELGLDPSAQLRELERQVLRQELPGPPATAAAPPPVTPAAPSGTAAPSPAGAAPPNTAVPGSPDATGSAPAHRHPPLPVSSFVGRADLLPAVAALLADRRVVTLCGPGGVGKTRLALHAAARVADRYDDGVLLVELGDGGPPDVLPAVAAGLRLADGPGRLSERIVEVLAVRRQLVVLDNCEHVADEMAVLVEAIARGTSWVDLLLTSREPLRVDAEHVVGVGPLAPDDAATLLADRLAGAGGDPSDGGDLLPELCRRLDGLPLALELAAARAAPLGLPGLLAALDADETFDVLRGGRRTAVARHRSLADVVSWSHALLDEPQRRLFERLAVFAGPVERSAVDAVCGESGALADLVERSLVVRHRDAPDRFGMLETLRAFGRARLAADPAGPGLRARHAAWAVALAREVGEARLGPGEAAAVRRFDAHLPDLRRAHGWLCANGPVEDLLRLSVLLGELAYVRGRIDLVRLVEQALDAAGIPGCGGGRPVAAHPLVPRLLGLLAASGWQRGDLDGAEARSRQAIAIADRTGEPVAAREAHEALANVANFRGDRAAATRHARRAVELAEAASDPTVRLLGTVDLACAAAYAGDHAAAARHEADLVEQQARLGARTSAAWLDYVRGELRAERDEPAAAHLVAAIRAAEEVDSGFIAGVARHTLLTSAARDGDPAGALPGFGPLLDHWHGFGAWTQIWMVIRALAETLCRLDRHHEVAVLLGAMASSPTAAPVYGADLVRLTAVADAARAALGAGFDTAHAEGASLGDQGAVALVRRLTRRTDGARA